MRIEIEKGYGKIVANFLRQLLITKVPCWRPIAFAVGSDTTIVSVGDSVLEDSTEIVSNLVKYHYEIDSNEDFYVLKLNVKDLNIDDLNRDAVHVLDSDGQHIFHSMTAELPVVIYFAKAKGSSLLNQNQTRLRQNGIDNDRVVVFNARFTNLDAVQVTVEESSDINDIITLEIESHCEINEEELLHICCSDIVDKFSKL